MYYKYIELYNYAGIYNGMGLTQIKIDFTKCRTNKIIIRGSNGSGKSTLMNAINPNPDSNDKFIPGAEARKIICLVCNGIEYLVRYIHPITNSGRGTTKGYISKTINGNMVELNPNGNVSSCKDILYEEFNLDSNFISLSQLSSENRGLVDNRPAERKKLLNNIINILDVYNGIYKSLSKKSSTLKTMINSLTYKIDYIGDKASLQMSLSKILAQIESLESEKATTIEAIAAVKLRISEYLSILQENNYDSTVTELEILIKDNKATRDSIERQLNNIGVSDTTKVKDFIDYIKAQIIELKAVIDSERSVIPTMLAQQDVDYKDLQAKTERYNSLTSEYNYKDIEQGMKSAKEIISKYDKIFSQMGLMNINLITKTEFDSAMESLKYLKDSANALMSSYDYAVLSEVFLNKEMMQGLIASIPEKRKSLTYLNRELAEMEKSICVFESKRQIASELTNRPDGCSIDDCPYIESALKANNEYPQEQYEILLSQVESHKLTISNLESTIARLEQYLEIYGYVSRIERELSSKYVFISKLPVSPDFKDTFMERILNFDKFEDIDRLYSYVDCGNMLEEYRVANENLKAYESEYKIYQSKNDIIESILRDMESLSFRVDELSAQIHSKNDFIMKKESELASLEDTLSKVDAIYKRITTILEPNIARQNELSKIKDGLDVNNTEIKTLQGQLNVLNTNLGSINSDLKNLSSERDKLVHSLALLNDYKNELDKYLTKSKKIETIKYYSSPSTGIQTLFMQLYMNKIITTANNLLSLLFEGEFVLQPFIVNENEFRIPCMGNGLMHDDISSMSTAQKCMISMILSFSLLQQSSTKYNVIKLDEVDAALDTNNRGFFTTLLDQIMRMLNCEQCFIISHNNELDTTMADLIVLKNSSNEIYSGNIIWQF